MPDVRCQASMEMLNFVFDVANIMNDGHEILARLEAGDTVAAIVEDLGEKFGEREMGGEIRRVVESWPPLHLELVRRAVQWALGKLDTSDRVMIRWKGDDQNPETVTKIELRDHELLIEFAHPVGSLEAAQVSN